MHLTIKKKYIYNFLQGGIFNNDCILLLNEQKGCGFLLLIIIYLFLELANKMWITSVHAYGMRTLRIF